MYNLFISMPGGNEWALIFIGALLYILPSIIAGYKESKDYTGIWLINIFLGWTVIGWVVALLWALRLNQGSRPNGYINK